MEAILASHIWNQLHLNLLTHIFTSRSGPLLSIKYACFDVSALRIWTDVLHTKHCM